MANKIIALIMFTSMSLLAHPVWGCSVCMGDPESPLIKGIASGVILLIGVIGTLLVVFGSFFGYLFWRSRHPLELNHDIELTEAS